jgi:hypothetical protein
MMDMLEARIEKELHPPNPTTACFNIEDTQPVPATMSLLDPAMKKEETSTDCVTASSDVGNPSPAALLPTGGNTKLNFGEYHDKTYSDACALT